MDVRASLNCEDNIQVEITHGDRPFVLSDSFSDSPHFPQATSTVARTKSRKLTPTADSGSFLEDLPDKNVACNGARPKVRQTTSEQYRDMGLVPGNQSQLNGNGNDGSDQEGASSLGLINVDDLDLESIDLLLDPLSDVMRKKNESKGQSSALKGDSALHVQKGDSALHAQKDSGLGDYHSSQWASCNSKRDQSSTDTITHQTSSGSNTHCMSSDSNPSRMEASSGCSSGQDSRPDQPFARSNVGTVKKIDKFMPSRSIDLGSSISPAARSLFDEVGGSLELGVNDDHVIELSDKDIEVLDAEFTELMSSDGDDSDEEKTPENKRTSMISVEDIKIDSIFLRPGVGGEETAQSSLPYLSKVSLFEGGSGSEMDTEDELEMVRQSQGVRQEAAGEDSFHNFSRRPGLVGGSHDDLVSRDHQLPITQRQSAEGDVVSSPVPGDGGGGGDGSSGTESDDGRRSNSTNPTRQNSDGYSGQPSGYHSSHPGYHSNVSVSDNSLDRDQEQRIGPMGDDLLSEICFTSFSTAANAQDVEDSGLPSRYLVPGDSADNSVNSVGQNPFGCMVSSFGSFGLEPDPSHRQALGLDDLSAPVSTSLSWIGNQPSAARGTSPGAENEKSSIWGTSLTTGTQQSAIRGTSPGAGNQQSAIRETSPGAGSQQSAGRGTSPVITGEMDYAGHSLDPVIDSWDSSRRYEGLGKRGAGSGSPSRGSGSRRSPGPGSPSIGDDELDGGASHGAQHRSVASPVSSESTGFISKSDPEGGSNTELQDVFKKPTMPAPKSANISNFSKSTAKPRVSSSSTGQASCQTSGGASGQGSRRPSASSETSEYVDLAYRMSLTGQAEEQRHGLRRVPSIGGTTVMDMSIPDDAFFNNDAALEMLDADEHDFEKENVIRQDDAMADTGSPNDSWAYKSFKSMARPSWLDDADPGERISVGTYMMGRTEALGSLDTDYKGPRPDFGMTFQSPPHDKSSRPARLIEVSEKPKQHEQTRTCGVGQYRNDSPGAKDTTNAKSVSKDSQEGDRTLCDEDRTLRDGDQTLRLQQLLDATQSRMSVGVGAVSALDLEALGIQLDDTSSADKTILKEISMIMKDNQDVNVMTQRLKSINLAKSTSQASDTRGANLASTGAKESSSSVSSSASSTSQHDLAPKASQLPIRKGSGLSRCFPKVSSSEKSFQKSEWNDAKKDGKLTVSKSDSLIKGKPDIGPVRDSIKSKSSEFSVSGSKDTLSKASSQEDVDTGTLSSPNTSSYAPSTVGLLDRLDDFHFAEMFKASQQNLKKNISNERKNLTNPHSGSSDRNITSARAENASARIGNGSLHCDREQTPPPDGEDRLRIPKTSTVDTSVPNIGKEKHLTSDSVKMKQDHDRFNGLGKSYSSQRENQMKDGDRSRFNGSGMDHSDRSRFNGSGMDHGDRSRLNGIDHGYMPGHHIPDGTEYSERSDYAHMGHKGMLREEVAGVEDVGLAESRGFDVLKGSKSDKLQQFRSGSHGNETGSSRSNATKDDSRRKLTDGDKNKSESIGGRDSRPVISEDGKPSASSHGAGELSGNNPSQHAHRQPLGRRPENLKTVETQTGVEEYEKLESWTQTSLILREGASPVSVEKMDVNQNTVTISDSRVSGNRDFSTGVSGIPPKLPVTSFGHNSVEGKTSSVREKPYLLTKTSLLETEFAQENLKRDYSAETLERIYASRSNPDSFHQINFTNSSMLHRESVESNLDWTLLKPRDTIDTVNDFSSLRDTQGQSARDGPSSLPTNFHSTHTHVSQSNMVTPLCHSRTQVLTADPRSRSNMTADQIRVSPVQAPGVLYFRETCCVGISRTEVLPLFNPTDRWMECVIQVLSLSVDGQRVSNSNFPFEMRRGKVIIDPHKTEEIDVMFLPKFAGAYVAQVQVFSQSFLNKDNDSRSVIPINVTFQAVAEDPRIKVTCGDGQNEVVNFGEMVWGSCFEKTVCIRNKGNATVPLRLALTSNGRWHCFSFEPDGRMSDVSVISGRAPPVSNHGRSIINISLPGASHHFHYHEVKVWCRPPDKPCTKVMAQQPPEEILCDMDVDVDIPCSKIPKLASLRMRAVVGVQKLHISTTEMQLCAAPRRVAETSVTIQNAGNLELDVSLHLENHTGEFSVKPSSVVLPPGADTNVMLAFSPTNQSIPSMKTLLLMMIQPEGPSFEMKLQGNVLPVEQKRMANILCDNSDINFGGVPVGGSQLKRFQLRNNEEEPVSLSIDVQVEDIQLSRSQTSGPSALSSRHLDPYMKPKETVPVYVIYSPSAIGPLSGKIIMKPDNFDIKYTVVVCGYGGVSMLGLSEESTEPVTIRGYPCVGIQSLAKERVKQVYVHNNGVRPAVVKMSVYKDFGCNIRMLSGEVVAQPSKFTVQVNERQQIDLVVSMTDDVFNANCSEYGVGAVLGLSYQDQVDCEKPHRSHLQIGVIRSQRTQASVELRPVQMAQSDVETLTTPNIYAQSVSHTYTRLPHTDIPTRLQPRSQSTSATSNHYTNRLENTASATSNHYTDRLENTASATSNHYTDRLENTASATSNRSQLDNSLGWNIQPQQIDLYCSSRGYTEEMDKFCITNNNNRDISFELAWPGGMLYLKPDRGTVRAREKTWIQIFPSTQATQHVDSLPWNGTVMVNCRDHIKTLKVRILPEVMDDKLPKPEQHNVGLEPAALQLQPGVSNTNTLGNLRVSQTVVQFRNTSVGGSCEETIELTNNTNDMLRWIITSFAQSYFKKGSDMFRVSYKVFDFSQQFGKLDGQSSVQLTLKFMPRSTGTFTQYWDIQKSGSASNVSATSPRKDYIRIHLTGEGVEEDGGKNLGAAMMPRLVSDTYKLIMKQESLHFTKIEPGAKGLLKVELKNNHLEDVRVEVEAPRPPFFIRHPCFTVQKKRFLRLPVDFQPSAPGKFSDVVRLQGSKGENLALELTGECGF